MPGDREMKRPLMKERCQEENWCGEEKGKFSLRHVEFEVPARHDHETGHGAGTPDRPLKI